MSVTAERLMVEVQADVRQALAKLDQVEAKAATSAGRMSKMAKTMGMAFGGAAVVGGIKKTVDLAMNFDATMRQVGVQTDETGKSLKGLSDLALKMGRDTVYSAQDASGAMLELAKGGLGSAEIRAGALESTLKLAAAGGVDLANAATYITQGMNTFGLGADKADAIVTALAGGANASTASVETLGQALSQVGPGATNAGMSIQETVAALAAFDNAGIKGSDAGTSLKTMLSSLVPATRKSANAMREHGLEFVNADGSFKSMTQVAQELKEGLGGLSEEQRTQALRTIFGSDATRAATVLMKNGEKGIRKYIGATKDSKKAQEMANTTMEGAKGAWENLTGAAETAAIQVGTKLLPLFTKAATTGAEWISTMSGWGPEIQATFGWVPDLFQSAAGALKPVVDLVKAAASAWAGLPGPIKEMAVQGGLALLIFPRLAAAASTAQARVVSTFTTMSAKARQFGAEMTYAQTRTAALAGAARSAAGPAGMLAITAGASSTNETVKGLTTTLGAAAIGFSMGGPLGAAIGGLAGGFMAIKGHMDRTTTAVDKTYERIKAAGGPVASAKASLADLKESLDQVTGAYTATTRAAVLQKLEQSGVIEQAGKVGISAREVVNAAMGQEGAWKAASRVADSYHTRIDAITAAIKDQQADLKKSIKEGHGSPDWMEQRIYDLEAERVATQEQLATLKKLPGELNRQAREVRKTAQATADYTGKLKGIPKKARTAIMADGIPPTVKGVADLAKRYNILDRKKVKTLVEATGADLSVKKIMALIEKAKELGRQKPKPKADLDDAPAKKKAGDLLGHLRDLTAMTAKPSAALQDHATGPIRALNSLISTTDGRTITITTVHQTVGSPGGGGGGGGGRSVGRQSATTTGQDDLVDNPLLRGTLDDSLKNAKERVDAWVKKLTPQGQKLAAALLAGFTGTAEQIASQVDKYAERVNAAYDKRIERLRNAKGKKGEDGKREPAHNGGQIKALEAERDRILKAAEKYRTDVERFRDAAASLTGGFGDTWDDARQKMAELRKTIQQTFTGKAEGRWLKVVDAANKQLEGLYATRVDLAGKLEKANQALADIQQEKASFVDSVFSGMNSQATVLNAGNNAGAIAQNLQTQVAKVREFAALLGQLRGMGYSDAIVMQVASAGVEGGMSAAKALAAASGEEMASINSSMAQITSVAQGTADALGAGLYDAGIASAQALADGLQSQYDANAAQINQMAYALQETMRKELRSGMKQAGRQAGQGLIEGLEDKKGPLGEAAAAMGKAMIAALKAELKIKSPSRVMRGLGRFVPQGMALGILDDVKRVDRAATAMGQAAVPSGLTGTERVPVEAMTGGLRAGASISFTFITHNPQAEPESVTTNNALAKVASLSLV